MIGFHPEMSLEKIGPTFVSMSGKLPLLNLYIKSWGSEPAKEGAAAGHYLYCTLTGSAGRDRLVPLCLFLQQQLLLPLYCCLGIQMGSSQVRLCCSLAAPLQLLWRNAKLAFETLQGSGQTLPQTQVARLLLTRRTTHDGRVEMNAWCIDSLCPWFLYYMALSPLLYLSWWPDYHAIEIWKLQYDRK